MVNKKQGIDLSFSERVSRPVDQHMQLVFPEGGWCL